MQKKKKATYYREDFEAVWVCIDEGQHRNVERGFQLPEKHAGGHIRLPFARDDNRLEGVVNAVFCQSHEDSVLLHQQYEVGVGLNVGDFVGERGDSFAANSYSAAVNQIAVFQVSEAPYHQTFLRSDHV